MRTPIMVGLAVGAAIAIGYGLVTGITGDETVETASNSGLTMEFRALADGAPLVFNESRYQNPGGDGTLSINEFRFFLSNIRLEGDGKTHAIPDSYHLALFNNDDASFRIDLADVPLDQIEAVNLAIGIDPAANTSRKSVGDLDPNSRMAWNWEVGYKFVLLEGTLNTGDKPVPIVFHIGFSENRRDVHFDLPKPHRIDKSAPLVFDVEIMRMFTGASTIDLSRKPSVIFDKADAKTVADNYADFISLKR